MLNKRNIPLVASSKLPANTPTVQWAAVSQNVISRGHATFTCKAQRTYIANQKAPSREKWQSPNSRFLARISHCQREKDYTLSIERRDRKSKALSEQFQWRVWCLVRRLPFFSGVRSSSPVCGPLQMTGPLPRSGELASRSPLHGEKWGLVILLVNNRRLSSSMSRVF